MNKGFLYVFLCFILSTAADAANRVVTGVVLAGDDNQPLVGVSIQVPSDELKKAGISSNTLGTITDVNGNFSAANAPSRRVIRHVRWRQKYVDGGRP